MTFINRAEVSTAGVLGGAVAVPDAATGVLGGIGYVVAPTGAMAVTTANPVNEGEGAYLDAFRFNNSGQMFVWNFDVSGLPPGGVFYTGGIPFTKDGQLVVTAQPVVWYCGGWPIAANNYVVGVPTGGGGAAVPATPAAPTAVGDAASATVTWAIPADGGSAITSFTVQPFIGAVAQTAVQVPGGATTSTVVPGLVNGTTYTFKVAANNGIGQSAFSLPSNAVVVGTVPAAPTIGVATVAGVGQANLTFTANGAGSNPIVDYLITSSPGAITWVRSVSPSFLAGLTPGIAYTFTVQARNVVGFSLPSAASNAVTT
jgi:hypothetical protein